MTALYESMFLLDNAVVREGWDKAKAVVTDTLQKHGATVTTIRRWDERKLAYTMRGKNRGTYALCYFSMGNEHIAAMRREFDLNERLLRYLILRADEVPATENELAAAEHASDFTVPPPPPDDMVEPEDGPIGQGDMEPQQEMMVPDLDEEGMDDDRPRTKKPEGKPSTEV